MYICVCVCKAGLAAIDFNASMIIKSFLLFTSFFKKCPMLNFSNETQKIGSNSRKSSFITSFFSSKFFFSFFCFVFQGAKPDAQAIMMKNVLRNRSKRFDNLRRSSLFFFLLVYRFLFFYAASCGICMCLYQYAYTSIHT